jgi:AhpD family alkylhydroperoxidase
MARVPYLTQEEAATPEAKALWQRLAAERPRPTANVFRAVAHAPAVLDASLTYADALRHKTELDPRLRELAILTVGQASGVQYEVAHHAAHAVRAGVSAEQLADLETFETSEAFDTLERAVMRVARQSTIEVHVSDEAWAALKGHLSSRALVELALTIGFYNNGVRIMAMLDIDLEPAYAEDPVVAGGARLGPETGAA